MKFLLRFFCYIFLIGLPLAMPASAQEAVQPSERKLTDLWIEMGLNEQLVDWFNQNARPDDIARADHISLVDLLSQVKVGHRLIVFKSVYDAENLMPHIGDAIDIIGYNLEHGPANRPDEQADPVGSTQRMRDLADRYHKQLAFGPDRSYAINDGAAIAPYVDFFILQVQKVQTEPDTVRQFVQPLVYQLRQANPNLKISIQVRTEGDVAALGDLLDSMKEELDGISVLTSPETVPVAEALWQEVRRDRTLAVTPAASPTRSSTPTATPPPPSSRPPGNRPYRPFPPWFWQGGWLFVWVVGGALLITLFLQLLYSRQTRRTPR